MFISFVVLGGLDVKCLVVFFEFWIQFTLCLMFPKFNRKFFFFFWAERIAICSAVLLEERNRIS